MSGLVQFQNTLAEDDAQHKAVLEVYGTLCNSLKTHFAPFIPNCIHYIVGSANSDVKIHMEDQGMTQNPEYRTNAYHQMVVDLKILGGKKVIS
jgi:phosphoenolpyruvate carboxylase